MFCTRSEAHDAEGGLLCTTIQRRRHRETCLTMSRSSVKGPILVLRQMHDIGHARHTHECGTRRESKISDAISVAWKVAHITSICSGIPPKHIVSVVYYVVKARLQSGIIAI